MAAVAQEEIKRRFGVPGQGNVNKEVDGFLAQINRNKALVERLETDQGYGRIFRALRDERYLVQDRFSTMGFELVSDFCVLIRPKHEKHLSVAIALGLNSVLKLYKATNNTGYPFATTLEHLMEEAHGHTRENVAYHKGFFFASAKLSKPGSKELVHELFVFLQKPTDRIVEFSELHTLEFEMVQTGIVYTTDTVGMKFYLSALIINDCAARHFFELYTNSACPFVLYNPPSLLQLGLLMPEDDACSEVKVAFEKQKPLKQFNDDVERCQLLRVRCSCKDYLLGWSKLNGLVKLSE